MSSRGEYSKRLTRGRLLNQYQATLLQTSGPVHEMNDNRVELISKYLQLKSRRMLMQYLVSGCTDHQSYVELIESVARLCLSTLTEQDSVCGTCSISYRDEYSDDENTVSAGRIALGNTFVLGKQAAMAESRQVITITCNPEELIDIQNHPWMLTVILESIASVVGVDELFGLDIRLDARYRGFSLGSGPANETRNVLGLTSVLCSPLDIENQYAVCD